MDGMVKYFILTCLATLSCGYLFGEQQPLDAGYAEDHFFREFINMLITLAALIALLFGGLWIMKRLMASKQRFSNASSDVKVLEQRTLSTKTTLYLVQVHQQTFLIADAQGGVSKIADIRREEDLQE